MNFTRMKPAKPRPISEAKPRQRATAITTGGEEQREDDQRRPALEVGELVLRRLIRRPAAPGSG